MTIIGLFISSSKEEGIRTLALHELDNSKFAECFQAVGNYLRIFLGVPGFKYEIKPYFEVSEVFQMIGMG